jgi:hypothetical protein
MSFRYDENVKKEIEYIQSSLDDATQSYVVKEAIHAYYVQLKQEKNRASPAKTLAESGYIGSFKAAKNLSTHYKQMLTSSLKKKHGIK